jgi:hypothetical protein
MITEKERKKAAARLMKLPPGKLEQCDLSVVRFIPPGMTRAFRNNRYTVMIFDNSPTSHGPAIRVMVQKLDNTPIMFHWREMQKIKNEVFGAETVAVEYYPAESELHDTHNIYWMWIYPAGVLPIPIMR